MFTASMPITHSQKQNPVLPEPQYPVWLCLHLTKLEALNPQRLYTL